MRRNKQENWNESVQTVLSYWFCVIATGIQLFIGIRYISDPFGQLCLVEFGFGLAGLLFLDWMHTKRFSISKTI